MSKLHLHVKTEYFNAVKDGSKLFEYRLANPYWKQRLYLRSYESIVYYNAYKPGPENRIEMPWIGWKLEAITHPHFGSKPVEVYAIHVSNPAIGAGKK